MERQAGTVQIDGGVYNFESLAMRLTRGKLKTAPDWSEWQQSEGVMLDQYEEQGLFGEPVPATLAPHVGDMSATCRRHVGDMSATSPNVAKSWPTLRAGPTRKSPRHTQFSSITADKYKSVQTYELATLP